MPNQTLLDGVPVALAGTFISPGTKAPDFSLTTGDLKKVSLADGKGKRLLLNIFPSVDTPTCSLSVRKFNELAAKLPDTRVWCISRDLPFAQSRFCAAEGIENVVTLSDFHYASHFGIDYGVLISDGPLNGLLARAVVIIDPRGTVVYAALSEDISREPDYEAALAALGGK